LLGNTFSDGVALGNGFVVNRAADKEQNNPQGGIGVTYKDPSGFQLGAYYAHTSWRRGMPDAVTTLRSMAVPFIPGNPDGHNPAYRFEYVPDVDTFAVNATTQLKTGTTLFGEVTYRANQPVQLNGSDLLAAFVSGTAPTPLRVDANATSLGSIYPGYDRYQTLQINLGIVQQVGAIFGAQAGSIGGEFHRFVAMSEVISTASARSTVHARLASRRVFRRRGTAASTDT
jgi:hypothetical protein